MSAQFSRMFACFLFQQDSINDCSRLLYVKLHCCLVNDFRVLDTMAVVGWADSNLLYFVKYSSKKNKQNVELVDVVMVLGVRRLVTGLPVRSPPPVAYVFRQVAGITARYAPSPKKIEATPPMISRPRTSPVFSSERWCRIYAPQPPSVTVPITRQLKQSWIRGVCSGCCFGCLRSSLSWLLKPIRKKKKKKRNITFRIDRGRTLFEIARESECYTLRVWKGTEATRRKKQN